MNRCSQIGHKLQVCRTELSRNLANATRRQLPPPLDGAVNLEVAGHEVDGEQAAAVSRYQRREERLPGAMHRNIKMASKIDMKIHIPLHLLFLSVSAH